MKIFLLKNIFLLSFVLCFNNSFGQKSLPKSTLTDLDGKIVNVQNVISKDQITILSFWATWCYPCIKELDAINSLYKEWQEESNVELIAISVDDTRTQKRIRPIIERKEWPYKFLLDENEKFKTKLNLPSVPQTVVIKDHKIIYSRSGYISGDEFKLYEVIKKNKD